ncbi:MAG: hypothetical protein VX379_02470 [Pseudomonadota bacterium]|uniref:hypothetical protein n=1 Tax=Alcanivorax sp. TaxID=1872427 RepID=UPI002440762F|nr:hypothetical protein [Alcanivorax sp.]MED5238420.1 hypothetical protein [Pseudomonadota bacterium]MEE3319591.1 hypothetical protein [Pseudomonadota bacterium]
MIRQIVTGVQVVTLLLCIGTVQGACRGGPADDGAVLHARYDVYDQTRRYRVDFYRGVDQVAWRQGAVISVWSDHGGAISLLRAFPQFQRSLWYPAADLAALDQAREWSAVAGWPAPVSLGYSVLEPEAGIVQGCPVTEYGRGDSRVLWVDAAGVPARIVEAGRVWQLVGLERVPQADTFVRWQRWPSTDFADVGDSEADPFLRRMIAQGFMGQDAR